MTAQCQFCKRLLSSRGPRPIVCGDYSCSECLYALELRANREGLGSNLDELARMERERRIRDPLPDRAARGEQA